MLLTSGVPPQFFAPLTCQLHLMESLTSFSLKHFLHPSCTPPPSSESPPSLTAPSRLPGLSVQPSSLLPVLTFLPSDLVQSRASIFSICWWLKHFAQAELSFPTPDSWIPLSPAWFTFSGKHLQPRQSQPAEPRTPWIPPGSLLPFPRVTRTSSLTWRGP